MLWCGARAQREAEQWERAAIGNTNCKFTLTHYWRLAVMVGGCVVFELLVGLEGGPIQWSLSDTATGNAIM